MIGVLQELKNNEYTIKQGFSEIICTAGNLLATSLLSGDQVSVISIFGLAINYDKLSYLDIDFDKYQL